MLIGSFYYKSVLQYVHYARTKNSIQDRSPDSASPGASTAPSHLREGVSGTGNDECGEVFATVLHDQTGEPADYFVILRI